MIKHLNKKIFYWSPFIVNIATPKAVINSAISINRYSDDFKAYIINFFREFDDFKSNHGLNENNFINFYKSNFLKYLPKNGKIQSRISFLFIFLMSIRPLHKILKEKKPNFIVIQLITSLPLILLILFNYNTNFILRISGKPKLGFFRKLLWKIAFKKIYAVTCPTKNTFEYIKSLNIIQNEKLKILYDPVICLKEINRLKKIEIIKKDNFFLAVGRLTKQKNFLFLIKSFSQIVENNKEYKLYIVGDGEERNKINYFIKNNKLEKNIKLISFKDNIYPYYVAAKGFILTSLWEDPGFVLVEAAFLNTPILSSNCKNGPDEILDNGNNGVLFENNNEFSFREKFNIFYKLDQKMKKEYMLKAKKYVKRFSFFSHYQKLKAVLEEL